MSEQSSAKPWSKPPPHKGPGTQLAELKDLVVGYAKQELIDPLKALGRHMGFGLAGSVLIGLGLSMLLLALLRGLQQIDLFNDPASVDGGTWSWAPYLITGLVGMVLALAFLKKLLSMSKNRSAS